MKTRVLSWLKHQFTANRTAWVAVMMLGVGFGARDVWTWATTPDPYEALLYYDEPERRPLPPHLDYSTYYDDEEGEQYDMLDGGRFEMAWVAMDELYGITGVIASWSWRCAIYDFIGARKSMTEKQILIKDPSILPAYQRLEEALRAFADVDCGYEYEKLDTYASACDARVLARIVQYQIAKGGSGGDVEFDAMKMRALFDRQYMCEFARESGNKEAIASHIELRGEYIRAASKVAKELKYWNPKCARLIVECMNRRIDPTWSGE